MTFVRHQFPFFGPRPVSSDRWGFSQEVVLILTTLPSKRRENLSPQSSHMLIEKEDKIFYGEKTPSWWEGRLSP